MNLVSIKTRFDIPNPYPTISTDTRGYECGIFKRTIPNVCCSCSGNNLGAGRRLREEG